MAKTDILFGIHVVQNFLEQTPHQVVEIVVQIGKDDKRFNELLKLAYTHGIAVTDAKKKYLDDISNQGNHQGVIAKCKLPKPKGDHELLNWLDAHMEKYQEEEHQQPPFLLILDNVTDPHNLGACLRSAAAAGVHGVIVPKDKSVGMTPTVRKVASGAAETVPFYQITNLARTMRALKDKGVFIVGTLLNDQSRSLYDIDLKGPLAIVMGAEDKGLRRLTSEHCDELAYIPIDESIESLNVSVATGVCLFEAVRQRL